MPSTWKSSEPGPGMPQVALPTLTPVTKRLLVVNGAVFVAWFLLSLVAPEVERSLLPRLGLTPEAWRLGFPFVPLWQLGTYGFLHSAQGLGHVVGNLLMLYFFGTLLEGLIGSRRFLVTYFGAQLAGAVAYLVPGIFAGASVPAIGASGAVYGIMIATAVLRPRQTVFLLFIPITLKVLAIGILAVTVFEFLQSMRGAGDGVAHLVHLGGIAYGFGAARLGWIRWDPMEALAARRASRAESQRGADTARMDQLLEKIHREGMSSLTRGERAFLKRVSARK